MFLGIYLCMHTYIQYVVYCFIFILSWTISESEEKYNLCALLSPKVDYIIKCWVLVPVVSWASAVDEAPGTLWAWGFWAHLQHLISLSGPCFYWTSRLPCVWKPTAPVKVRGCQWCWGTMSGRWRNIAQAHHCCVCTPQHPPSPRWHPLTVWRIIL